MNKKVLLISLLAVTIGAIVFVLVSHGKSQPKPLLTPSPTPVTRPYNLPTIDRSLEIPGAPRKPTITVPLTGQTFPEKLPVYKITPVSNDALMALVAKKLGFTTSPKIITDKNFSSWEWKEAIGSLSIKPGQPIYVSFTRTPSSHTSIPNAEEKKRVAENFLLPFVPTNIKLTYDSAQNVDIETDGNLSQKQGIKATLLSYRYTLDGYKVFLSTRDEPEVSVFVDYQPSVFRTSFIVAPNFMSTGERTLGDVATAITTLKSGGGILVGVQSVSSHSYETNPSPDYTSVSIVKTDVGYFFSYADGFVYPVYVFKGSAQSTRKGGGSYGVTYIVRATQ